VTGFEPFGGYLENPSGEIAQALDGTTLDGATVRGRVLPVSRVRAPAVLAQLLDELDPALVLLLGVAPGRAALTIERVAVNVLDFPIADNDGEVHVDEPVFEDGPAAYFSTLPIRTIAEAWKDAGIPGHVSDTAGAFLCNEIFYTARHLTSDRGTPAGFLHLPQVATEAARRPEPVASMPLAAMIDGVRVALAAAWRSREAGLVPEGNAPLAAQHRR
jgi:pyroglutamyl-peptidase